MPSSDQFDHLFYVRVFEGCNLYCKHCFIPSNPKKMSAEQIKNIPNDVAKVAKPGSKILLQWHGGEPTALGALWLKSAVKLVEENKDFEWIHGIQTNLITFSSEWAEIYHEHFNGKIGVSWDPKIRLMRKNSPESHAEYESLFSKNLMKAQKAGLEVSLVVTATKSFFSHFPDPNRFFDWLKEHNIKEVHLERITETGNARENWSVVGLNNAEYSRYMARYAKAYMAWHQFHPKEVTSISPFDGIITSLSRLNLSSTQGHGCLSGMCDTRFHTIDASGYQPGCTALTSEKKSAPIVVSFKKSREVRQINCLECKYKPICSSGCLATQLDDGSGECSGGRRLFESIEQGVQAAEK